jgi:hypothetical protein
MSKKKTLENFKKDLYNVWGDRYTVSPNAVYNGNHEKIEIVCEKHGSFMVEANSILHKHGCKECRRETIGKNRVLSQKEVIERLKKVWGDKYDLSKVEYINARTKITPICKIHGEFKMRFSDFENLHGCPFCNESRLENEISKFLIDDNIDFEREYKTEWLKNGAGFLKLDFYLPYYNVAIECQGKQHYTDNSRYGKNGEFENIKERDKRKFDLCNQHKIKILYYTDYKGEIPELYKPFTYYSKDKLIEEAKR